MIDFQTIRAEFRPSLRLAVPVGLAEVGGMGMAIVDPMMVGRLPNSAVAISAVSLGGILVHVLAFFGGGLLIGLDTLVSQAFGAGHREDCHRSLLHGIYLSLALTPFLMTPVWFFDPLLRFARIAPDIISVAVPYSKAMAWGTLPLLLYFAVRRCMQGMNMVRPISFALVTALIGRLGAVALASHQIALNTVSLTYMVPLGISSAAAVRVGQAIGRGDPRGAGEAGGTAILLGAAFMTCAGGALLLFPRWIARMYTPDETIIRSTILLLAAGAAFQLFDGIQTGTAERARGNGLDAIEKLERGACGA